MNLRHSVTDPKPTLQATILHYTAMGVMLSRKTHRRQIQHHVPKKVVTDSTQQSEETAEFYLSNACYLFGLKRLSEGCKTNFCF